MVSNYPHSPGTFVEELQVITTPIRPGKKTAVIIGETELAFEGSPNYQTPVMINDIPSLSVAINQIGKGIAQGTYGNPLYEQAYRHFLTNGGPCYVVQAGPLGVYVAQPTLITADCAKSTTGGTFPKSQKWHFRVTEYVTNTLVTKGETVASTADAVLTLDASTDTNKFTITHTKGGSATGWVVYMQLDGTAVWYRAADGTGATIDVTAPPTSAVVAELPTRSEALISQTAADLAAWQASLDVTKGLYDVEVVTCAGGFEHNQASPTRASNIILMKKFSDHCEEMYGDTYRKRIAVCPAIYGETHAQRINTTDYTNTSERLVKVVFNGCEGYVSGAHCHRNFDESITYFQVDECDPSETFQGTTSYPLTRADRDAEFALGWTILKPFEGIVRIMKGITAQCAATTPSVFQELFVRTVMDHIVEEIERHGDAFLGQGRMINIQSNRMILQADLNAVLKLMLDNNSIAAYSVLVMPNAEGIGTAVDVAFSITVSHEINQIFGYMTIGG
jgi:hypothetical protein